MGASRDARRDEADRAPVQWWRPNGALLPGFEEALIATVKALAASLPAPRHDPFYGLDRDGPGLRVLERLTRHGDFRKYVFVLDAAAGLGGAARWLALRYGCRVLALDQQCAALAVARRLTRRARLADRVWSLAGSIDRIPVRDATFTQIWAVEALRRAREPARAIAELFRVLRPGSPIALQVRVHRDPSDARSPTLGTYRSALAAAGFVDVDCEDVTGEHEETSPLVLSARTQLARRLAERGGNVAAARAAAEPRAPTLPAARDEPHLRVYQLFARRPSV
jgi:SAM-dependent methyltransferase